MGRGERPHLFDTCKTREFVAFEDIHTLLCHIQVQRELGGSCVKQVVDVEWNMLPSRVAPGTGVDSQAYPSCRSNWQLPLYTKRGFSWNKRGLRELSLIPFETGVLPEELVEIANKHVDGLSHMHVANLSVNGIRVGQRHGGVFVCSNSGLEFVSTHLSYNKVRLRRSPTSISFRLLSEASRWPSLGT